MPILKTKPHWQLGNLPTKKDEPIHGGIYGNIDTVKFMSKISSEQSELPKIRQLAVNIVESARTKSHNHLDEAIAIGRWVQQHVKYLKDIDNLETIHSPLMLVEQIERNGSTRGDCDDMALLTATLLKAIGIKPFARCVRYKGTSGPYHHIYIVVYENNFQQKKKRLSIDCIIKNKPIGYEVRQDSGDEYPL